MRILTWLAFLLLALSGASTADSQEHSFDDPMFQRCVNWMLRGEKGALIENICIDEYEIPPPSLFICARKVKTGFTSSGDREACAIIFEEEAKKVRAGFVR